jgi:hypothetical protein
MKYYYYRLKTKKEVKPRHLKEDISSNIASLAEMYGKYIKTDKKLRQTDLNWYHYYSLITDSKELEIVQTFYQFNAYLV